MKHEYQPPEPRLWQYAVGNGWLILAGKSNEDNDILSLRFARPEEHWFHINGMPGSHVILRGPDDAPPDKALIQAAAAVAAWHSKARDGGTCSVVTTLAKFVSKPRGAKPGTVEILHERIIRVKPALPNSTPDAKS